MQVGTRRYASLWKQGERYVQQEERGGGGPNCKMIFSYKEFLEKAKNWSSKISFGISSLSLDSNAIQQQNYDFLNVLRNIDLLMVDQ